MSENTRMVYWCSVCNKCCIGKFGIYDMQGDDYHTFQNGFKVFGSQRHDMFYKIQNGMSPSTLDMVEPVLKWIKDHIEADIPVLFNHYTCNGTPHKVTEQIKTSNAITAALRGY